MLELLVPIVILATGLAAGVLVGTELGGFPLLESLPPDQYVRAHAFFATRYDPFMPVCLVIATLGSVALAVVAPRGGAQVLYAVAAGLALAAVMISLRKNVPINKWVRTLDPEHLPDDFPARDPRRRWGAWNRTRAALGTAALLAHCGALALLL